MDDKRLELLMSYTTFHIGAYLSLATIFMGASLFRTFNHRLLRWAVGCFLVAGACGGIIAANIVEFGHDPGAYFTSPLKFWSIPVVHYSTLATIEHAAFWIGLLPFSVTYVFLGRAHFTKGD